MPSSPSSKFSSRPYGLALRGSTGRFGLAFTSFKVVLIVKMDRLISFRHLADCAERFIRAYATNLDKAGARDDLLLHFTNLGLAGMIKVEEQAKCMRLYDRLVAEAKMAMED